MTRRKIDPKEKKILFITGTRADFGKIEPLAKAAKKIGFNVGFFITGMHMMRRYGETRIEVKKFAKEGVFEFFNQREGDSLDYILSKTILGLSDYLQENHQDLVVIHGDRIETLAASVVCGIRNLRSCHIEGGELSGTIDESIRHCSTKFCTAHFVSNKEAEKRVLLLGESPDRIFNIGSPELDMHAVDSGVEIEEVKKRYEIYFQDYGIVIFHPVTTEIDSIKKQAKSLFDALNLSDRNYVVISPNNDPGSGEIFSIIEQLPKQRFKIIPSMRFSHFSELMKNASIMIGNSSAGVREAPFLGLASINIGTRQNKRVSENQICNCNAESINELIELVNKNWGVKNRQSEFFGTGDASIRFLKVIENKSFWELPIQKSYHEEIL